MRQRHLDSGIKDSLFTSNVDDAFNLLSGVETTTASRISIRSGLDEGCTRKYSITLPLADGAGSTAKSGSEVSDGEELSLDSSDLEALRVTVPLSIRTGLLGSLDPADRAYS